MAHDGGTIKYNYLMSHLTFIDNADNRVKIGPGALSGMRHFIQNTPQKKEAGGILLGRFLIGSDEVVVDRITIPMQGDIRSRYNYFRSKGTHQKKIYEAWASSKGTCNYLGEWHTHPEVYPQPSIHDIDSWKNKLIHDQYNSDFLFFVIVGTEQISVWKGYRRTEEFEKLSLIPSYSKLKAY